MFTGYSLHWTGDYCMSTDDKHLVQLMVKKTWSSFNQRLHQPALWSFIELYGASSWVSAFDVLEPRAEFYFCLSIISIIYYLPQMFHFSCTSAKCETHTQNSSYRREKVLQHELPTDIQTSSPAGPNCCCYCPVILYIITGVPVCRETSYHHTSSIK